MNAHRKYNEHPVNRMQEIKEDNERFKALMEEIEKETQGDDN